MLTYVFRTIEMNENYDERKIDTKLFDILSNHAFQFSAI